MFPEVVADVMGTVIGAQYDGMLAGVGGTGAEFARVHYVAGEGFGAGDLWSVGEARHTGGKD